MILENHFMSFFPGDFVGSKSIDIPDKKIYPFVARAGVQKFGHLLGAPREPRQLEP